MSQVSSNDEKNLNHFVFFDPNIISYDKSYYMTVNPQVLNFEKKYNVVKCKTYDDSSYDEKNNLNLLSSNNLKCQYKKSKNVIKKLEESKIFKVTSSDEIRHKETLLRKRKRNEILRNNFYNLLNWEFNFSSQKGKFRPDCLRKKIKTNHFHFLNCVIGKFLNISFYPIYNRNIRDEIRINQNREIYKMTIVEFLNKNSYIFNNHSTEYFSFLLQNENFIKVKDLTLFEFFKRYYYNINCLFHKEQLDIIKYKNNHVDRKYYLLYLIHDLDYINYFEYEGGNVKSRKDIYTKKPRINNKIIPIFNS